MKQRYETKICILTVGCNLHQCKIDLLIYSYQWVLSLGNVYINSTGNLSDYSTNINISACKNLGKVCTKAHCVVTPLKVHKLPQDIFGERFSNVRMVAARII